MQRCTAMSPKRPKRSLPKRYHCTHTGRYKQIHGEEDLTKSCRLCLKHNTRMSQIFEAADSSLELKITSIIQIEIRYGDGLPASICKLCAENLNVVEKFVADSISGEELLRTVLNDHESNVIDGAHFKQLCGKNHLSTICRVCAMHHESNAMLKIFVKVQNSLEEKIRSVFHSEPSEEDGLPGSICNPCAGKLSAAYDFITKSRSVDDLLRNKLYQIIENEEVFGQEIKIEPIDIKQEELSEPDAYDMSGVGFEWAPYLQQADQPDEPPTASSASPVSIEHFPCASCGTEFYTEKALCQHFVGSTFVNFCSKKIEQYQPTVRLIRVDAQQVLYAWNEKNKKENIQEIQDQTEKSFRVAVEGKIPRCIRSVSTKEVTSKRSLKDQMQTYSQEKPFSCDECSKTFWLRNSLTRHKHIHTGTLPRYFCSLCTKQVSCKRSLKEHMHSHTGERPFSCDFCGKKFRAKRHLSSHERIHTGTMPRFVCAYCTKEVTSKGYLKEHIRAHYEERPSCKVCHKTFKYKSNLARHEHIHKGTNPSYICPLCNKEVTSNRSLQHHLHTHSGRKPFSCKVCDKTYTTEASLTRHEHVHTGTTPLYVCAVCGKEVTSKNSMKLHTQLHTGERPFSCEVCGKTFTTKLNLTRHTHNIHDQ